MSDLNRLYEMQRHLNKMTIEAKRNADNALNSVRTKVSPSEFIKLKNLTNFENINSEVGILERIDKIKEWAQRSQD